MLEYRTRKRRSRFLVLSEPVCTRVQHRWARRIHGGWLDFRLDKAVFATSLLSTSRNRPTSCQWRSTGVHMQEAGWGQRQESKGGRVFVRCQLCDMKHAAVRPLADNSPHLIESPRHLKPKKQKLRRARLLNLGSFKKELRRYQYKVESPACPSKQP